MKIKLSQTIVLLVFLCGFMSAANAFAATLTVTKSADTADGICDADCSLREAVVAAVGGDVIVFSPLFNLPQTITLTGGQIAINKNLTIAGVGADLLTVSGNDANRIFYISDNAAVALSGMKLSGGLISGYNATAGAIYLTDSTLTLTNMTLSGNTARYIQNQGEFSTGSGGAISSYNSTLSIINSAINDNYAPTASAIGGFNGTVSIANSTINHNSGGAEARYALAGFGSISVVNSVFNGNSSTAIVGERVFLVNSIVTNNGGGVSGGAVLTIDRCNISDNNGGSYDGTGISSPGIAIISNTIINNNYVDGKGGGIFNGGDMNIYSSTISNNTSTRAAGGIYNVGSLKLTNSTVSGNVANSSFVGTGGGIYNEASGSLILTNSTIANNRAGEKGGGLRQNSTGTITIRNTIIAGNSSPTNEIDVSGAVVSQGYNLIGNTTGSSGWIASDLLNRNSLLAPLGNNGGPTFTHALMPGSPAINAGNNALAVDPITNAPLRRDQRDNQRRVGNILGNAIVDIGAYEFDIAASPVTLSGRVLTFAGRGISNARITLTDANGAIIYAQTNPFGYYRFVNLLPGTTYTITVISKRYKFNSPQVVTVDRNRDDLNFIASSTR